MKGHHTVFEGEMYAIGMGLEYLKESQGRPDKLTILSDCQAVIRALIRARPGEGKMESDMYGLMKEMEEEGKTKIRVRWVPGHVGVEGNERADQEAKRAVRMGDLEVVDWGKNRGREVRKELRKKREREWQEEWDRGLKGRFTHKFIPKVCCGT